MQKIRAEQSLLRLFEQETSIPAVGQVWGGEKAESVPARGQNLIATHAAGRPEGEVIHTDDLADEGTEWLRLWCLLKPVIETTDFIRFEMTPGDIAKRSRMNQGGQGIPQFGEYSLQAGMKEQRFIVANKEVIELQIKLWYINAKSKQIGGDFGDGGHRWDQKSGDRGRGFRLPTGHRVGVFVALGDHPVTGCALRNGWRLFLQCRTASRRRLIACFGPGVGVFS